MATKKEQSVDQAIEEVAGDSEAQLSKVKEALAEAHKAMDKAGTALQDAYGAAKVKSKDAAEKAKVYLEDARKALGVARERMSTTAAKTREQAEALYGSAKQQYESLSAKSRDAFDRVKERVAEVDFKQKGDQVVEYVRDNPGKSILIALAAGFLVGYLTRPRD